MKKKHIITGAPGVGKTTLIHQLHLKGFSVIPEVSRDIIQQEQLKGSNAVPWEDVESYARLVYREIKRRLENNPEAVFTDRSLIDIIAYLEFYKKPVFKEVLHFPFLEYYHPKVFFAPSWQEIYKTDAQRPQQYLELQGLSEKIEEVYKRLGFNCIYLPKVSTEKRVKFVVNYTDIINEV